MTTDKIIAKKLLEIKAVSLLPDAPYTWASGILSPIYCDNRITISHPDIRDTIADGFVTMIRQYYPDVEVIAGTATAGIPHAAFIADRLHLPMVYIRSKPKDHGQGHQIEGQLQPGQKMVVVDDLISTGGSVLTAVDAAKREGANVLGVAGIFTYELEDSRSNFENQHLPLHTLTNYSTLIDVALEKEYIDPSQLDLLNQWKQDPRHAYSQK